MCSSGIKLRYFAHEYMTTEPRLKPAVLLCLDYWTKFSLRGVFAVEMQTTLRHAVGPGREVGTKYPVILMEGLMFNTHS